MTLFVERRPDRFAARAGNTRHHHLDSLRRTAGDGADRETLQDDHNDIMGRPIGVIEGAAPARTLTLNLCGLPLPIWVPRIVRLFGNHGRMLLTFATTEK